MRPPLQILWYVLCMLAVGLAEELTFRGLVTQMIYEKYGYNSLGVWLSVVVSGLLFGAVHLVNAAGGEGYILGVLVQMVGACSVGKCLAAIYLRTRSLWTVVLLHGYMDFCALMTSGFYSVQTIGETVGGYPGLISFLHFSMEGWPFFYCGPVRSGKLQIRMLGQPRIR